MPGVFENGVRMPRPEDRVHRVGLPLCVSGVLRCHHAICLHFHVPDGVDMFHWSMGWMIEYLIVHVLCLCCLNTSAEVPGGGIFRAAMDSCHL